MLPAVIRGWLSDLDAAVPRLLPNALIRRVAGVLALLIGSTVASGASSVAMLGLILMWGTLLLLALAVMVFSLALIGFGVAAVRIRPPGSDGWRPVESRQR
jgi:hypothetical protein